MGDAEDLMARVVRVVRFDAFESGTRLNCKAASELRRWSIWAFSKALKRIVIVCFEIDRSSNCTLNDIA